MLAGTGVIRTVEGTARVCYGSKRSSFKKHFDSTTSFNKLSNTNVLSNPLTNFQIQMYYQSEPRFNGVYSRDFCLMK